MQHCPTRRARRGALGHVSGRVNGGTIDTGRHTAAPILVSESGDTVETNKAAHRFSAISMRSLNDPRQGSLPTVQPLNPEFAALPHLQASQHPSPSAGQFRLALNGLSRICAETDVLQR